MKRIFFISCAVLAFAATEARAQVVDELIHNAVMIELSTPTVSPGQSLLPHPSQEGNEALDQLLNRCLDAHGVHMAKGAGGRTRLVLANADRVKKAVSDNRHLLTPALRDAVVARWSTAYKVRERREPGALEGIAAAMGRGFGEIDQGRPGEQAHEDHQRLGVVLLRAIGEASGDNRVLAFSALLTGQAEERAGDFAAALNDYERARRLFADAGDLAWEAACLNNLGTVYSEQGEYSRALELLQGAVTLGVKALSADHSLVATCQGNMGEVFVRMEDYPHAEEYLKKALDIWSKISGEQRPMLATTLISLGDVYNSLQRKDEARSQFERALAKWQEMRGDNRPGVYYLLGRKIEKMGDEAFDRDKELEDLQTLTSLRKAYGDDAFQMAATLDKLGDDYAGRKQYDQALEQYGLALDIRRARGESHPGVALAYHNIGNIHKIQGRYDDALRDMEQAVLALREPGRAPATLEGLEAGDLRPLPLTVEVLHDWACLLELSLGATPAASQLRRCSRLYRLAGDVMERMRQEVLQAEVSKVSLGAKHFDLFSRHIGVLRRLFAVEGKAEGQEAAFAVAEQGIARVFLEQIGKSRAASIGRVSDEVRRQETRLINRLLDLDARIANEQGRPRDRQDPQRLIRLFEERRRVEGEQLQLVARMEREYPQYAALRYPRPCSLAEARACLGPNEAALLYVLGDEASYLIVVAKDDDPRTAGLAIHELGPAGAIAKTVDALVHPSVLISLRGLVPIPWEGEVDAREREAQAYRMLLAPAAEAIRGRDLVIVPGGPLGYLPFELLIEPRGAKADVEGGRYLVEGHRIRYAPSLTVLSLVRQWERTRARPDRPLGAVGDPVYEPSDERGFDLRLMSSVKDVSAVPTQGKDLIIVAAVNNVLHFRIFDGDGRVVVDTDEQRLTEQARQIEDLRKQLESLWPSHELTRSDKDRVTTAVTSIVGHTRVRGQRGQGKTTLDQPSRGALEEYCSRTRGNPMSFARLSFSGAELQAIGQIMAAAEDDSWIGLRASEALIKGASEGGHLAQYRYVHFATHGILGFDIGRQPSLVLSLVDGVGNDGREGLGGRNDGFLQMDEVTHLHLNADLVVLSACQTGLGRLRNGEGVESLTRAFLYAGSRAVLCSLWSVADRETSELMADVYRNLKAGRSAPDALREAQLAMIKAGKPPLYWAPFITIGE